MTYNNIKLFQKRSFKGFGVVNVNVKNVNVNVIYLPTEHLGVLKNSFRIRHMSKTISAFYSYMRNSTF